MSNWKAVFRNKKRRPQDEGFACCGGCDAKVYGDGIHKVGPKNGICTCPSCVSKTVSHAYRENYREIFGHD